MASLAELLETWRATRSPALADVIDRVSPTRRALGGASQRKRIARWDEIAVARDPLDLPRLVAALANCGAQTATARLPVIAEFAPDPRIAKPLVDFITSSPYSKGVTMAKATARIHDLLVAIADARVVPLLDAHPAIQAAVRLAVAHHQRPLDAATEQRIAALSASYASARSGDELLAAIRANPDDDAPRIVFADWLLEQGNTWGELIHLQLAAQPLAPEADDRMRELLVKHDKEIVGALAKVIARVKTVRRGFLSKVVMHAKHSRTLFASGAAAEWLTVEDLTLALGFASTSRDLLAQAAFRNVKTLREVDLAGARALGASQHAPRVDTIVVAASLLPAQYAEACRELATLPNLSVLVLASTPLADAAAVLAGPLAPRLRRLILDVQGAPWPYLRAAHASGVTRLFMHHAQLEIRASRAEPGLPWIVELPAQAFDDVALVEPLRAEPPELVAEIRRR